MNRSSRALSAAGNDGTEMPLDSMSQNAITTPPRILSSEDRASENDSPLSWRSRFTSRNKPSYAPIDLENMDSISPDSRESEQAAPPYISINLDEPTDSKPTPNDEEDNYQQATPMEAKSFHRNIRLWRLKFGRWIHAREVVKHLAIFIFLFLLLFFSISMVTTGTGSIRSADNAPFVFECNGGDGWSFLGINMVVATNFNYGTAKAVDLAWNWVVGRGLQGILSLLAYRVFCDALLRAAEFTPMSYELYACVAVSSNKLEMLWQLAKGLGRFGNWRVKCIFVWLFLSTVYLIAFPGLMDACSGYDAAQTPSFKWPGGDLQTNEEILRENYYALRPYQGYYSASSTVTTKTVKSSLVCATYNQDNLYAKWTNFSYIQMPTNWSESYDETLCPTRSQFRSKNPHFQYMKVYNWTNQIVNASWWARWEADPSTSQVDYWHVWGFWPSNKSNFVCDTKNNVYQWGFTYEWFVVVVGTSSVWLFGMYVLWVECQFNSELCKKKRHHGIWRAIADLSEAMREDLGPNICAYSNKEIAKVLEKRPPIKYYVKDDYESEAGHIGLSSRPSGKVILKWDRVYAGRKKEQ